MQIPVQFWMQINSKVLDEVQDGMGAKRAYIEAINYNTSPERKDLLRERLLKYCKYDTLSMVCLVQFFSRDLDGYRTT